MACLTQLFACCWHSYTQRLTLQLGQVEHQQSLAASEAALAPLNPFQRNQVCLQQHYIAAGLAVAAIAGPTATAL